MSKNERICQRSLGGKIHGSWGFLVLCLLESVGDVRAWTSGSGTAAAGPILRAVPRVDKADFDPFQHYLHGPAAADDAELLLLETPVLVEHVLDPTTCEQLCSDLWSVSETLEVDLQRKQRRQNEEENETTHTEIYPCMLDQAIDLVLGSSHHDDSVLVFEEGLLEQSDDPRLMDMSRVLTEVRESLFPNEDWLQYFPSEIRPTDCLIMAGEGATSTLHRDPLEWTGTSMCLEGTKIWRFIPPTPHVSAIDDALQSYRLTSMAWDQNSNNDDDNSPAMPLSAGWQSNFNLYAHRSGNIPSARELDEMSEAEKQTCLEAIAMDCSALKPNVALVDTNEIWTVVQKPGDLVVIPAYWWHQTYALEPSIAVASQRCDTSRDVSRMVHHILDTTGTLQTDKELTNQVLRDSYDDVDPRELTTMLFDGLAKNA
eukprot:scaffold24519_cov53-Attheya_sp.AAC.6